jgi:para-aminobenzoate synthetase component I
MPVPATTSFSQSELQCADSGCIAVELFPAPSTEQAFLAFEDLPHVAFLDSAMVHAPLGQYSFLTAEPLQFRQVSAKGVVDWNLLRRMNEFPFERLEGLPPFQGGVVGVLGYELNRQLEKLPSTNFDDFEFPPMSFGCYDTVLCWDHAANRCWIVSQGWPETSVTSRQARARQKIDQWVKRLDRIAEHAKKEAVSVCGVPNGNFAKIMTPQYPVERLTGLTSNFSREGFLAAVQQCIDYIYAGDIFQVNLAQRLLTTQVLSSPQMYRRLRQGNPATFAAYFDLGEFQLLSASPERFLKAVGRSVETRPIKGTRRRTSFPEADLISAEQLRGSEKDRAENIMIVDLLRNDLSRVCTPDSVVVTQFCEVETYRFVQHLVSAVKGELAEPFDTIDLLQATFPGGSITGAPKVRAMQIITELEQTTRGAYCGSLGYICPDGDTDWNILIRTITAGKGYCQIPVGGGIVAQSDPQQEYEETWVKATGMLRAVREPMDSV